MGNSSNKIFRSTSVRERRLSRKATRHQRSRSEIPVTEELLNCPDLLNKDEQQSTDSKDNLDRQRDNDLPKEPNNIPYAPPKQIPGDLVCSYCGVYTGDENHPCNVCDLVFHKACLTKYYVDTCSYDPKDLDASAIEENSWTCYKCEDLMSLLTVEEHNSLMNRLEKFGIKKDTAITHANFLRFQRGVYNNIYGEDMKPEEMRKSMGHFEHMDIQDKGELAWKDFINSEVVSTLKHRPEFKITHLLKTKEIEEMRTIFRSVDIQGQGSAKTLAVQCAFCKWLIKRKKITVPKYKSKENVKEAHSIFLKDIPKTITWHEFINKYALSVIAARTNNYGYIYTEDYVNCVDSP